MLKLKKLNTTTFSIISLLLLISFFIVLGEVVFTSTSNDTSDIKWVILGIIGAILYGMSEIKLKK